MNKVKNVTSVFAVCLLAMFLLTACASNSPTAVSTEKWVAPVNARYMALPYTMADISYGRPAIMVTRYDVDMYAGAPKNVQEQISAVDALIAAGQYEKAFYSPIEGDYGLAKKAEIAHQYFAYSMMHQMFAFKNLEPGEDLMDIRRNYEGNLSMTMWNPEEILQSAIATNPDSGILHMALAWYYADTRMRYGDQWLKTPEELARLSVEQYQLAVQAGLALDAYQLSMWAESYMELKDAEQAIPLLEESLSMYDSADVHYNLGMCYSHADGDYIEQGLAEFIYAAQCYEYIPYKIDALLGAVDFAVAADELELAKACNGVAYALDPENPNVMYNGMELDLYLGDVDEAVYYATPYYAMFYQYLDCLDDIATVFANYGQFEQYNLFLDSALAQLSDNMEACGHLHYFYAVYWANMEESYKAKTELLKCRDYYKKAGLYEGETKEAIENLIANM